MRLRNLALVAAAFVLVAAVVVTLVVVVGGSEAPPSAATALARAQRFVASAESVEYRGVQVLAFGEDLAGEKTVERTTFEEAAVFPDRSHSLALYEDSAFEAIAVDGFLYSRDAAHRRALGDAPWAEADGEAGFFSLPVPPEDLPDLLAGARRPRVVGRGDVTTTLRLAVDEIDPDIFLIVADDGRPTRLAYTSSDSYGADALAIEFERWNGEVDIGAPATADIDPTPLVDEDAAAEYDDAALFQPRVIPEGWVLDSASVLSDFAITDEDEPCETVMLFFLDPESEDGYLSMYLAPEKCSLPRPRRADDFVSGPYEGWIAEELDFLEGTFVVEETMVQFDTDLTAEAAAALLGDLVPLDFASLPTASPAGQ